ncbi:hypothetical protein OUZ56_011982 [Daphnia magna]|uniref:DUF4806 domain-containing protein n=1 Tax=Daphnia magna TaxID=35525 RepID=A0ABQ9Z1Q2_9CRUS|nr:hypothetical protein OUZ56_011982 [Daphnia magna]
MFQEQDGCYEDHGTFAIVDLHCDGTLQVAIVPDFWLFGDEGELYCSYPPGSYELARKTLSSAVQYTDLSEDEDLEQHLETNGPNLRRSMRRKKKPFSSDYKFDVDLHDKPSLPFGGLGSPKECDKGNVPSSDDDPPSDDDEEHGQSLTKYLKRNKRMPLSADTSSDGSDLLEMEGITPSLYSFCWRILYIHTKGTSPVKVNTPLQSEDESNSGTLNQSANGESQSYQDAGRNRPKNSYFNQAPIVNHVSRRVSVEKPSSDGNRSHGQIDSALLGGNSFRRAPVEHSPAIKRRVRENSIPLGQPDGKRQNAEPVASGSRYREDSWDQVLPGCSTNKHTSAPSANGNRSRPIHKASHGRRSTENSTDIERTASKGHHHQPTPDANSNRQAPSKQPAASGNSHTPKVNVNTASPRYPGVLVTAKQPTSSVNYAKEVRRKEAPPVGEPLRRPSVSQLIPNGNRRAAVDPATTPVRRVSTGLNNHPSSGVNDCRREFIKIAGRIDTYRPEVRENLDPLNELPLSTLEDLVAFQNALTVDERKREALARFVKNIGGATESESVKRAWKEVVSVNVRALCNWYGVKRGTIQKHKLKKSPIVLAMGFAETRLAATPPIRHCNVKQ